MPRRESRASIISGKYAKETAVFKLFVGLPLVAAAALVFAFGGLLVLPLLGLGVGLLGVVVGLGVLVLVVRLLAAIAIGLSGLLFGALMFGAVVAVGATLLALGAAIAHLLVPVLVICGLVWLIRRLSRPLPPAIGNV
jgi:hypothetical protein